MTQGSYPEQTYAGIRYRTHPDVYEPHDDTWLLVDAVQGLPLTDRRVLEVGCGAGVALIAAAVNGARCVGLDRNPAAVRLMLENAALNGVRDRVDGVLGDLVASVRPGGFDLVLFNPPYLPVDPDQPVSGPLAYALEGGPTGDEVIQRFLDGLESWTRHKESVPELLIVLSNHNDEQAIRRRTAKLGLHNVEASPPRRYFFHRLWVEHHRP